MVSYIPNGKVTKEAEGAAFSYTCKEGGVLEGPRLVHCDGKRWSSGPSQCLSKCI